MDRALLVFLSAVSHPAPVVGGWDESERIIPMSVRQFLDVVPKSVKTVAAVIAGGGVLIGLAVTVRFIEGKAFIGGPFLAVLAGAVIAIWILGLGYVNGDARRRGMPPILWT